MSVSGLCVPLPSNIFDNLRPCSSARLHSSILQAQRSSHRFKKGSGQCKSSLNCNLFHCVNSALTAFPFPKSVLLSQHQISTIANKTILIQIYFQWSNKLWLAIAIVNLSMLQVECLNVQAVLNIHLPAAPTPEQTHAQIQVLVFTIIINHHPQS